MPFSLLPLLRDQLCLQRQSEATKFSVYNSQTTRDPQCSLHLHYYCHKVLRTHLDAINGGNFKEDSSQGAEGARGCQHVTCFSRVPLVYSYQFNRMQNWKCVRKAAANSISPVTVLPTLII